MSRWTEFLAAYSYQLIYKPGSAIGHADALSRCPLPSSVQDPAPAASVFLLDELQTPVSASDISVASASDPVISRVLDWVRRGWPQGPMSSEFLPYHRRQHELSTQRGCLLWGNRVIVPPEFHRHILEYLHEAHPGVVRMKALGRGYVWWPNMDREIEQWVATCTTCQQSRSAPPAAPAREWESPRAPWARIHMDLVGPFQGRTFLVVVDAYSKWVELALMGSTCSEAVARVLEGLFTTHGLPDTVVTDNGPQFVSAPFRLFLARLGIRHTTTAPFHPAANGLAERAVRSAKEALGRLGPGNWHHKICQYLLAQHTTPCPVSRASPAELLMGRRLRTTLDRLHPSFAPDNFPEAGPRCWTFSVGDPVYAQNFGTAVRWLPGRICELTGPYSYRVHLEDGRMWRRHINQLRRRVLTTAVPGAGHSTPIIDQQPEGPLDQAPPNVITSREPVTPRNSPVEPNSPITSDAPTISMPQLSANPGNGHSAPSLQTESPLPRRSGRVRRKPTYLSDYACAIRV